jgi:hypothetical protein
MGLLSPGKRVIPAHHPPRPETKAGIRWYNQLNYTMKKTNVPQFPPPLQFRNFIQAESMLRNKARNDLELANFGVLCVQMKQDGNPFTSEEIDWMRYCIQQAENDHYRILMEGSIINGLVRDCRMSRRWMATGR